MLGSIKTCIQASFRDPSAACRAAIGALLVVASLLAILLLGFRGYYSGRETYFFLFKDLVLAWVPMCLSLAIAGYAGRSTRRPGSGSLLVGLVIAWVVFLPNAPYLLTEFVHLNPHHAPHNMRHIPLFSSAPTRHVPIWYDAFMILMFAWTGLLLGVLSLRMVQQLIGRRHGPTWGWAGAVLLLALSGFGVTLGRFERFNSWDILVRPGSLLVEVAARVCQPLAHLRTTGATLLLSAFLLVTYLTMAAMMNMRELREMREMRVDGPGTDGDR